MKINRCLKFRRVIHSKPTGCAIGDIFKCISVNVTQPKFKDYKFACVMTGDVTLPNVKSLDVVNAHVYFKVNGIYQSNEIKSFYDENEETLYLDLDKIVDPVIWK